jgi:hypothetical protein
MFMSVGSGSRYVPLVNWTWYWKAESRKDAGTGIWSFVANFNKADSADVVAVPNNPEWSTNIDQRTWK